jgi:hypothetical protein
MILDGSNGVTFNDASLQGAAASPYVLKNRIINGDMRIDQRNAGASVTVNSNSQNFYDVDRFYGIAQSADGVFTLQQNTSVPTGQGFVNSMKATITTADASIGATQQYWIGQEVEGYNVADLQYGTANAKTVTLSFWVNCSVTGTFSGCFMNSASDRSYPFTYTISAANTWEQKTITIAGDTTGTWLTTNGTGISVQWSFGAGSSRSGTANTWAAARYHGATGATALISTLSATFYITGVQLEQNTSATPFERRLYNQELANCQRYFETSYEAGNAVGSTSNPNRSIGWFAQATQDYNNQRVSYAVSKRANPSVAIYNPSTGVANQIRNLDASANLAGGFTAGSTSGFFGYVNGVSVSVSVSLGYHYTASSEL